ncbi:PREDICTED: uncharacterized protein LOC104588490 isoform X2 [Nelumbo nucifera]|uniref:Uncharacterized protein LOC104588490 isoform X2 n=2 Tax=Nelumbo nucifera TaxID=4432 RepID=A0A1U7ZBT8_NELNU|nr:PREDICTED: uncharacterized protein LOC104588490 isoform X2 [Nelumbo nucifera]DAD48559.1 TPA_asm: hypothetical protein HUJ06_018496 [Nelumbo nucifera]
MAGSTRFELASGSPEGSAFASTYPNGQRGNYSTAGLDRSRSFREGMENRMPSSGPSSSRGITTLSANMPLLSQCLTLEPIMLGNKKPFEDLRKSFCASLGGTSDEQFFGTSISKPFSSVVVEDIKRFRNAAIEVCNKARDRAKTLSDSLSKLDKYCEALDSRKQRQRNELLSNERSSGTNLLKIGSQMHQNRSDLVGQRLEERTKNVVPNKRVRTSIAEAEGRTTTLSRPPVGMDKDRDMLRAGSGGSIQVEEKIRGLPAGGEGWDKKMKRKRSVGTVVTRAMDGDREIKRAMRQKLNNDPRSRACDTHGFRSVPSNGISGINKLDGTSQPTSSNARTLLKNELENVSLPRDRAAGLDKERGVAKGNNKLNIREDTQVGSPSPVTKGKASRAPRNGSSVVPNSSPTFPRASGAHDVWEQPPNLNKVQSMSGTNNRKRPMPTGSSSPPMAQWVGQRPQKISRTRRANLVSPVSNPDDAQISSDGFPNSDIGCRLTSNEANGSLLARGVPNNTQQFKMKHENVPSPARLSESEESGAGENKLKDKGMDNGDIEDRTMNAAQKVESLMLQKKNKMLVKEETGDGVRRQGRSGRGSSLSRACVPPVREKLENAATTKPLRSTRPGSDKNESKSGRPPSKKLADRKAFTRPGHVITSGSSDFAGESDDDHEELLAAANSAHKSSYLACSSSFWKKIEPLFASVNSDDLAYLRKQLNFVEELEKSLCHMFHADSDLLGELVREELSLSQPIVSGERQVSWPNGTGSNVSATTADLVDPLKDIDTLDMKTKFQKVTPLYQRVLSALIEEDESEEFDRESERSVSFHYGEDSPYATCMNIDFEPKDGDKMEPETESELDIRTQKKCPLDAFSCDGSTASNRFRGPNIHKSLYSDELWQRDGGLVHSDVGVVSGFDQTNLDGSQHSHADASGISSFDSQYQQMSLNDRLLLELQSIGLYPETVPDLAEGEEEINKDIMELRKGLYRQVGKKKGQLSKVDKAIQESNVVEERELEVLAMSKLTEIAYKKLLACRGSHASKHGLSKISKQAALAFVRRVLARCHKFEDTGISCFTEPSLRNALLSVPSYGNNAKFTDSVGSGTVTNTFTEAQSCQPELRASGGFSTAVERHGHHNDKFDRGSDSFQTPMHPSDEVYGKHDLISNRGKKKEVLLDDVVGTAASRATPALGNTLLGGVKGKRSERDRDQNRDTLTRTVAKAGRPSLQSFRGERKTKTKPKQKTAQLSTSGNGLLGRFTETTHPVYPSVHGSREKVTNGSSKISGEVGLPSGNTQDSFKEAEGSIDFTNLQLHELDTIEGLGVSNDLGGPQDLSSWLNFDEDGLQDHDSMGLEIPMDDLSELNMLI